MHLILLALLYGVVFTLARCGHGDVVRIDRFSRAGRSVAAAGAGRGSAGGRIAQTVYRAEQSVEQAAERFRYIERNANFKRNARYTDRQTTQNGNTRAKVNLGYNAGQCACLKHDCPFAQSYVNHTRAHVDLHDKHVLQASRADGILFRCVRGCNGYDYVAGVSHQVACQVVIAAVRLGAAVYDLYVNTRTCGISSMTQPAGIHVVVVVCGAVHSRVCKLNRQVERQVGQQSHNRRRAGVVRVDDRKIHAVEIGHIGSFRGVDGKHTLEGDVIQPQVCHYAALEQRYLQSKVYVYTERDTQQVGSNLIQNRGGRRKEHVSAVERYRIQKSGYQVFGGQTAGAASRVRGVGAVRGRSFICKSHGLNRIRVACRYLRQVDDGIFAEQHLERGGQVESFTHIQTVEQTVDCVRYGVGKEGIQTFGRKFDSDKTHTGKVGAYRVILQVNAQHGIFNRIAAVHAGVFEFHHGIACGRSVPVDVPAYCKRDAHCAYIIGIDVDRRAYFGSNAQRREHAVDYRLQIDFRRERFDAQAEAYVEVGQISLQQIEHGLIVVVADGIYSVVDFRGKLLLSRRRTYRQSVVRNAYGDIQTGIALHGDYSRLGNYRRLGITDHRFARRVERGHGYGVYARFGKVYLLYEGVESCERFVCNLFSVYRLNHVHGIRRRACNGLPEERFAVVGHAHGVVGAARAVRHGQREVIVHILRAAYGQGYIARDAHVDGAGHREFSRRACRAAQHYFISAVAAHTVVHKAVHNRVIAACNLIIAAGHGKAHVALRPHAAAVGVRHCERVRTVCKVVQLKAVNVLVAVFVRGYLNYVIAAFNTYRGIKSERRRHVEAAQVDGQFNAHAFQNGEYRVELYFQSEAFGVEYERYRGYGQQSLFVIGYLAHCGVHLSAGYHIAEFVVSHRFHIVLARIRAVVIAEAQRGGTEHEFRRGEFGSALRGKTDNGIAGGHSAAFHLVQYSVRQYGVIIRAFNRAPADVEAGSCAAVLASQRCEPHIHIGKAVCRTDCRGRISLKYIGGKSVFLCQFFVGVSVNFRDVAVIVAFRAHHGMGRVKRAFRR